MKLKKNLLITILICIAATSLFAQKNKRESVKLSYINLPHKLIYDQIKTYSSSVSCIGNTNPYVPTKADIQKLKSYEVNDVNPDMKIEVNIGPLNSSKIDQQTYKHESESNGVKTASYTYSMRYEGNYIFTYRAFNTKNNYNIYNFKSQTSSDQKNITLETDQFNSANELNSFWKKNADILVNEAVSKFVREQLYNCNNSFSRTVDFTPTKEDISFFLLKKSDIDDEFNKNIQEVINVVKEIPSNDDIKIYRESLASKITYLLSLADKYKKEDKKEDVLYMSVNYDLACLYYSLDMLPEAKATIEKISDMKVDENYTKELSSRINDQSTKMARHFVDSRHLDYNPVKDFRLEGKNFTSNALNYSEIELKKFKDGAESTDIVSYFNGITGNGKVIFDEEKGIVLLYTRADINNPTTLKPTNVKQFTKNNITYVSATKNGSDGVMRQFFSTRYFSEKIRLVEVLDSNLKGTGVFGIQIASKINAPIHDFSNAFTLKKDLAEYISDCPIVSEKVKKGVYITMFKFSVEKMLELCKDYDINKN